jgi:hypothetical protein
MCSDCSKFQAIIANSKYFVDLPFLILVYLCCQVSVLKTEVGTQFSIPCLGFHCWNYHYYISRCNNQTPARQMAEITLAAAEPGTEQKYKT